MLVACFKKKATSIYSKGIELFQGPHCHVEILFSDGICFSSCEDDGGPRFKKIVFTPGEWDFLEIHCTLQQEQGVRNLAQLILDGAFKPTRPKYGWTKCLVGFLPIPILHQDPSKLFCSEVSTILLQNLGLLIGYTAAGISPDEMYNDLAPELELWEKYNAKLPQ